MKNHFLYGLFALLFVVATLTYIGFISPSAFLQDIFGKRYAFEESQQGIRFVTDLDKKPSELLAEAATHKSFILSPAASESVEEGYNVYWTQALVQQQIVLGGNGKVTLVLVRVFDKVNGEWTSCQTDYATSEQSQTIGLEECRQLLNSPDSILIEVHFPDEELRAPIVEVSPNKITLNPVLARDIPGVNFLLMRSMFLNAERLIGASNQIVGQTQNQDINSPVN